MLMEPDLGTLDGFAATVKLIAAVEFPLIGVVEVPLGVVTDRKSTRLNSSHANISSLPPPPASSLLLFFFDICVGLGQIVKLTAAVEFPLIGVVEVPLGVV